MRNDWLDLSSRGKGRIVVLTILGTLACILLSLSFDSYSFSDGAWSMKEGWRNNIYIPLLIAPAFFSFMLYKLRQLAIAHDDLMVLATTDGLTSCLTRRAFVTLVDGYLERVKREPYSFGALLVIDVDHFKSVNDRFGHEKGDEALRSIAGAIRSNLREIDLVGRMGGEEFGVFLPGVAPSVTRSIAERIRTAVNAVPFRPEGEPCHLSVSVGGATFDRFTTFTDLFRQADQRLYEAKGRGRDRVEIVRMTGAPSLSPTH